MVFGIKLGRRKKRTSDTWREEERKGLKRMPDEPTSNNTWREDNPKNDKSDSLFKEDKIDDGFDDDDKNNPTWRE